MKVAAYCRVSTDTEEQENSFENQQSYFSREIEAKGHTLYKVYADKGISGTKLSRPQFDIMLHDAGINIKQINTCRSQQNRTKHTVYEVSNRQPLFEEIWLKNTSRFARNTMSFQLIDILRQKGVYVFFLEQNINTRDISQDMLLKIMQIFDEQDSKDKSLKVKTGQAEARKQGVLFANGDLYGYRYIKSENRLEAIPEEATIIKEMFEMYAAGNGFRTIAQSLTKEGKLNRSGKPWPTSSIRNMIRNERYYGIDNSGKYKSGGVFSDRNYSSWQKEYDIKETDKIEPIISKELFNTCKEMMQGRISVYGKGVKTCSSKYAGMLVCAKCGAKYTHNINKGFSIYNCATKKTKGKEFCDNKNLKEENITSFLDYLNENEKDILNCYVSIQRGQIARQLILAENNRYGDGENNTEELEKKLANKQDELKRITSLYIAAPEAAQATIKSQFDSIAADVEETKKLLDSMKAGSSEKDYISYKMWYRFQYACQMACETPIIDKLYVLDKKLYPVYRGFEMTAEEAMAAWGTYQKSKSGSLHTLAENLEIDISIYNDVSEEIKQRVAAEVKVEFEE